MNSCHDVQSAPVRIGMAYVISVIEGLYIKSCLPLQYRSCHFWWAVCVSARHRTAISNIIIIYVYIDSNKQNCVRGLAGKVGRGRVCSVMLQYSYWAYHKATSVDLYNQHRWRGSHQSTLPAVLGASAPTETTCTTMDKGQQGIPSDLPYLSLWSPEQ